MQPGRGCPKVGGVEISWWGCRVVVPRENRGISEAGLYPRLGQGRGAGIPRGKDRGEESWIRWDGGGGRLPRQGQSREISRPEGCGVGEIRGLCLPELKPEWRLKARP